jgi:hypothetical protein
MKTTQILLLSAASLLMPAGCGKNNNNRQETINDVADSTYVEAEEESVPLQFETVVVNDTIWFDEKTRGFCYDLSFTFPSYYPDEEILSALQQQFITDCFGEEYRNVKPQKVPRQFFNDEWNKNEGGEWIMAYDFYDKSRSTAILLIENGLLHYSSVWEDRTVPGFITSYHIFSLRTGKPVVYDDIFKANVDEKLTRTIIDSYMKTEGYKLLDESSFEKKDEFTLLDNIKMEDNGLAFVYWNSIYTSQSEEIFVPYSQLLPYMKKDSPLYEIALKIK